MNKKSDILIKRPHRSLMVIPHNQTDMLLTLEYLRQSTLRQTQIYRARRYAHRVPAGGENE